jgi:hypothetical protein
MKMSANRTNRIQQAITTSLYGVRFRLRESSSSQGTKKWNVTRKTARYCQPLLVRVVM